MHLGNSRYILRNCGGGPPGNALSQGNITQGHQENFGVKEIYQVQHLLGLILVPAKVNCDDLAATC